MLHYCDLQLIDLVERNLSLCKEQVMTRHCRGEDFLITFSSFPPDNAMCTCHFGQAKMVQVLC